MVAEQTDTMTTMTDAQVKALIEGLLAGVGQGGGGAAKGIKKTLEDKMFTRLAKYSGVEKEWKEWDFNFQIMVKGASWEFKRCFDLMEGLKLGDDWNDMIRAKVGVLAGGVNVDGAMLVWERLGTELFEQMCKLTEGDANLLVRGTDCLLYTSDAADE